MQAKDFFFEKKIFFFYLQEPRFCHKKFHRLSREQTLIHFPMSSAKESKKRKADSDKEIQCSGKHCVKVATDSIHEECSTCEKLFCRECCTLGASQVCAYEGCTTSWCLKDFVRNAHRCIAGILNDDYIHGEDDKMRAHGMFCNKHSSVCVVCKISVCEDHNDAFKHCLDSADVVVRECARCSESVCGACSVQCTQCCAYECRLSCAKVEMWENESGSGDYFCQTCRHMRRREADVDDSDSQ
jgi:hypothetical protein